MRVCATEDKTADVVTASYRSVSRNPVRFQGPGKTIGLVPPYVSLLFVVQSPPNFAW